MSGAVAGGVVDYIAEVETTIGWREGRWSKAEIGPKTVIVGPNGSGKTRLLSSLSYLKTGRVPGEVLGREQAIGQIGTINAMSPEDLHVVGTLSDGSRLAPPKADPSDAPSWNHPVRVITTALRKDIDGIASFFLPFLVPTSADPRDYIPQLYAAEAGKDWRPALPATRVELEKAIDAAKTQISAYQSLVREASAAVAALPNYATVTPDMVEQAKASLQLVGERLAEAAQGSAARELRASWVASVARTTQQISTRTAVALLPAPGGAGYPHQLPNRDLAAAIQAGAAAQVQQVEQQGAALQAQRAEVLALLEQTRASLAQWQAEHARLSKAADYWEGVIKLAQETPYRAANVCFGCGKAHNYDAVYEAMLAGMRDQAKASPELQHAAAGVAHFQEQVRLGEAKLAEIDGQLGQARAAWAQARDNGVALASLLAEAERLATAEPPLPPDDSAYQGLLRDRQALERAYEDLVRRMQGAEQHANTERRRVNAEGQLHWWGGWRDTLEAARWNLLETGVAAFVQRVQAYLPPEIQFTIPVAKEEGQLLFKLAKRDADGYVHTNICGAERSLILCAVACTCLDLLPVAERPRAPIIMLDEERSIDPDRLVWLMKALSPTRYQVVCASIVAPAAQVPGWTVLHLTSMTAGDSPAPTKGKRGGPRGRPSKKELEREAAKQRAELFLGSGGGSGAGASGATGAASVNGGSAGANESASPTLPRYPLGPPSGGVFGEVDTRLVVDEIDAIPALPEMN